MLQTAWPLLRPHFCSTPLWERGFRQQCVLLRHRIVWRWIALPVGVGGRGMRRMELLTKATFLAGAAAALQPLEIGGFQQQSTTATAPPPPVCFPPSLQPPLWAPVRLTPMAVATPPGDRHISPRLRNQWLVEGVYASPSACAAAGWWSWWNPAYWARCSASLSSNSLRTPAEPAGHEPPAPPVGAPKYQAPPLPARHHRRQQARLQCEWPRTAATASTSSQWR